MKISRLSASAFDTYSWCEFKYALSYAFRFEDASIPSGVIGHICHKVLEILSRASVIAHRKDSKIWDVEYLWRIAFNRYYNKDPEISAKIKDAALKKAIVGIKDLLASPYTPVRDNTIGAEYYFKLSLPDKIFKTQDGSQLQISGFIDRVDKIDGETIEVIDYKTGSRAGFLSREKGKKNTEMLMEDIQPRMYHLAAKILFPWAKTIIVTFYYLTDGGAVPIPFCDEDIKKTKEMLFNRFNAIQSNTSPQRNRSWKCNTMCGYGKNGMCTNIWNECEELGFQFVQNKYVTLNIRK